VKAAFVLVLRYFFWAFLWLRYRIKVTGAEILNKQVLNKPGGILFLPNHTTILVDPLATALAILTYFPVRPLIVEYMYYLPIVHGIMRLLHALPVPNFNTATNSIKRKRAEQSISQIITDLKKGDNFLIYPSGRIKRTAVEAIGGASAVHKILQEAPEANIVLIRISGLWGSSFSRALTGQTPPLFSTLFAGLKQLLANLLFCMPRRKVTIEFSLVPSDFPGRGSRLEVNNYLDRWYNLYANGTDPATGGEPLSLISYSIWREKLPVVYHCLARSTSGIDIDAISLDTKQKVIAKLAEMSESNPKDIEPDMNLSTDLGLDSLDIAEVTLFLQEKFDVKGIPVDEIDTVAKVMALAARQVVYEAEIEEENIDTTAWHRDASQATRIALPAGDTTVELFFRICDLKKQAIACVDERSGEFTYSQLKVRALLLAEYIERLPGKYVGILLPASAAAYICVLACQIAGKIPLMVNWTVGSQHFEAIVKLTHVRAVLTSWSFIERLNNVNFDGIDELLLMLEDIGRQLSITQRLTAFVKSKRRAAPLMRSLKKRKNFDAEQPAVLLFTSGTESMPKGVPLSHRNILSNQRGAVQLAEIYSTDIMLGILPPFHAFGFTASGLLPLLGGMRIVYSPDPTDGKRLAKAIARWQVTMMCGAPTFIKALLKMARPGQLDSLRFLVSGAEKTPAELFTLMEQLGKPGALYEGYGITECAPILTLNCPSFPSRGVGRLLPNIELLVVHPESHQPLPLADVGLVLARGPNIFSGYLNPDVASPFLLVDGKQWYNTGDLGSLDSAGYLTLSGRLKRFVKIGGEMVSLSSIEDALIRMAKQCGWPIADEGPSLAISAKEEAGEKTRLFLFTRFPVGFDAVNKALREAGFSNLIKIAAVKVLEEIPIMGTGKVNYRRLEAEQLAEGVWKL